MKASILIPAFNEEKNIAKTLDGLAEFKDKFCKERQIELQVLVIDDGSSDRTAAIAAEKGVKVIKLASNTGKGGALREGLKYAEGDIVVFLDADLQETSQEVSKLLLPILEDSADVTIAKFKPVAGKKGFGLVKALAFYGVKSLTGREITTALSGQRAFKRQVLNDIQEIPEGFGIEVGMLVDILRKGYRVQEVDVDMSHDVTGRDFSGFVHRGKQFLDILKVLVRKKGGR